MAKLLPGDTRRTHAGRAAGVALALTLLACGAAPPPEAAPPPSPAPAATAEASAPGADAAPAAPATPASPAEAPPAKSAPDLPKEPAPGQATTDKAPLTGKISQSTIMDLVMKNQELFNDCYSIGAGKSKQFIATVTVKASIGPTGVVNTTQIAKSTAKNPKVDKCVAEAFKKMQFPATGSTVPITFPMEFNGAEQVK